MLTFLFKKERQLEALIYQYLENLSLIQQHFSKAMNICLKEGIRALMSTIDQNESHCDHIERRIITKLFNPDLEPFLKLQLKEMVIVMGEISDQADRVSKRINIMTMKRRV